MTGTFRAEEGSLGELAKSATPSVRSSDRRDLIRVMVVYGGDGLRFSFDKPEFRPLFGLRPVNGSSGWYGSLMKDDGMFRVSVRRLRPACTHGKF